MELNLQRLKEDEYGTHGQLLDESGNTLCYTIEQHWFDNQPDVSCIPEGTYQVIPHDTPHHPNCWEISGVDGRSAILIHTGNTVADTKGCVIVGLIPDDTGVLQSQMAIIKLRGILPPNFTLTVSHV